MTPEASASGRPSPAWMVLLAWAFPGAGHFALGRRGRAVVFCVIVLASLAIGCSLEGELYWPEAGRPLTLVATAAAMGVGAPYFVLRFGLAYEGDLVAPGFEYGTAFVLVAGLMNLLLVLDAWDIARGRKD